MLRWITAKLDAWAMRVMKKDIERLKRKQQALKAEILKVNHDKPIKLSPEGKKQIRELLNELNPEVRKEYAMLLDEELMDDDESDLKSEQ